MSEILTFPEGSAYLYTGGTSAIAAYVRNVDVRRNVIRHKYRPPFATTNTYTELVRNARLTIGQAFTQTRHLKLMQLATGGSVHCHLTFKTPGPNTSGGIWLWSGELQTDQLRGADGQAELVYSVQGEFQNWSGY
jgi:hypothetical protein